MEFVGLTAIFNDCASKFDYGTISWIVWLRSDRNRQPLC